MNLVRAYKLLRLGIKIDPKQQTFIENMDNILNDMSIVKLPEYSETKFYFKNNKYMFQYKDCVLHYYFYNFINITLTKTPVHLIEEFIVYLMKIKYRLNIKLIRRTNLISVSQIEDIYKKHYEPR